MIIANVKVSAPLIAVRPVPGIRCIPTGSMHGKNSIKPKLHRVLRDNELLYVFADFSQRKQMGIKFLGKLGHTPAGIPSLAKETGAAIIPAFTYPKTLKKMVVQFQPEYVLKEYPTKKEFLGKNMLELNNLMTWFIRKAPVIYFEHTSYTMLKTYKREVKVVDGDSREVAKQLLDLARQVVYTTYEAGRNDQEYYDVIDEGEALIDAIPADQISDRKFTVHFEIKAFRVRDSIVKAFREAVDLGVDKSVMQVILGGLQDFVIFPKAG